MDKNKKINTYLGEEFNYIDEYFIIDVYLYKELSLFNRLSVGKQLELNNEIIEYIDNKSEVIPNKYKLKIRFLGRKLSIEDKNIIDNLLHEHYYIVKEELKREIKKTTNKMVTLFLFGILLSLIYIFLAVYFVTPLFLEFISVVSTFSLWEAAGIYLFERKELKEKYEGSIQNLNQIVEYE